MQESIEFRQTGLETTLQLVYSIIWELKTHEIIENTVIMQVGLGIICWVSLKTVFGYLWFVWRKKLLQKLRERMHSRQVFNQSVCNCHEDSELVSTLVCLFFLKFLSKISILIWSWQLSMIDLVESIYSSLDKTSRTYYWQRLQGENMIILSKFGQQLFSILNL